MNIIDRIKLGLTKKDRGFTLLEYCIGAAVLTLVVWVGLNALGTSLSSFLTGLGTWVANKTPTSP